MNRKDEFILIISILLTVTAEFFDSKKKIEKLGIPTEITSRTHCYRHSVCPVKIKLKERNLKFKKQEIRSRPSRR